MLNGLMRGLLVAGCLLAMAAAPAWADKRVALVIGNGAYQQAPRLPNPPNDARAIAEALRRLNFQVIDGTDLGRDAMVKALRNFGQAVEGADVAMVFYAGHGIQVSGHNYLIPVDAQLQREQDLQYEAMQVDAILNEAQGAKRLRLIILDACRDNPFAQRISRSMGTRSSQVGRGFARIDPAESDTLIAYATRADDVAADGSDGHSPYTTALLQFLEAPGLEINLLFGKVRDAVRTATNDRQMPFTYGSLGGEPFYLRSVTPVAAPLVPVPPPSAAAPVYPPVGPGRGGQPDLAEMAFWDAIKHSGNPADYRAYLETYPNGQFAALARVRAQPAPSAPPAEPVAPPPVAPAQVATLPPPSLPWAARPLTGPPPTPTPTPAVVMPPPRPAAPPAADGRSGFQFCNRTPQTLETAFGYQDDDEWVSEGWWVLKPEQCATVADKSLRYSKYYVFATAQGSNAQTTGTFGFCVNTKAFTIRGDKDCEKRGYREERFSVVEVGDARFFSYDFTPTVVVAGGKEETGFRFCNKTSKKIDTAFGYQDGEKWVSEGWWVLEPKKCAKVNTKPLRYTKYYYYATVSGGGGKVWKDKYGFCVDSKPFTIIGDENCKERGFRKELFMMVEVGDQKFYSLDFTDR